MRQSSYTEYPAPIPVEFFDRSGYGKGNAIGIREIPLSAKPGKSDFYFLIMLLDGGARLVRQRDVLES